MHFNESGRQAVSTLMHRLQIQSPVSVLCFALCFGLAVANDVIAADQCTDPACARTSLDAACASPLPPRKPLAAEEEEVKVKFGTSTLDPGGALTLSDGVELRHGDRTLRAQEMSRDTEGQWTVPGPVELRDPSLVLRGADARLSETGTAEFTGTEFELPDRAGHGAAGKIVLDRAGSAALTDVRYTTCPGPKPDWALKVGSLEIDAQAHTGTARHARVEVRGIPVIYTPYISFPVGDQRKSGLLFPDIGNSDFSGRQVSVPWYWNIAPNYDATITPTWYSERGVELGTELRLLTRDTRAETQINYLPDDAELDRHRHYVELHSQTRLSERMRFDIDGVDVSDQAWLAHFGRGHQDVAVTTLPRSAVLLYQGNRWHAGVRVQNNITIDPLVALMDRPYSLMPQVAIHGFFPDRFLGFGIGIDGEYTNFRALINRRVENVPADEPELRPDGQRLDITPEIRLPLHWRGASLEPSVAFRHTAYEVELPAATLQTAPADSQLRDDSPTRSAPIYSFDGKVVFERLTGSGDQRLQTIEPRIMYVYVPYRAQDHLPIFDTTVPDFNLVQLFRTERYVGPDRLGDVNQLAMGATTRLLDSQSGQQYLSATVGGVYRFAKPQVFLPGEATDSGNSSDVIGEMNLIGYKDWSANAGMQWDPDASSTERLEVGIQYRPGDGRVVNAGYRYRKETSLAASAGAPAEDVDPTENGDLRQVDASAAWPIGRRFTAYGRFVYSLEDEKEIERMAGLEYQDCCWGVRFVYARTVSLAGEADNSWQLQIELKGLSSVGNRVDAFLERSIRGYSAPRAHE